MRNTQISVLDFGSEYLPLPYAPRSVSVAVDWAYDPNSLIMLSSARGDRDGAIRNLSYTVESVDVWGRRRLAYEIRKNAEGIYAVINVTAPSAAVAELDRQLNLNESVLRTKIIRPGK